MNLYRHTKFWIVGILISFLSSGCTSIKTTQEIEPSPRIEQENIQKPSAPVLEAVGNSNDPEDDLALLEAELQQMESEGFVEKELDYAQLDPLEKMNRALYGVHRGIDLLFVRPIALTYTKVLPKPVQKGLFNFVSNLTAPLRFLCRLLQGNLEEAGKTMGRFVTNTVLGFGGIFDVASRFNLYENTTSFGETFKKWGMKPGPYIVIPGIGPATFRTAFGFLCDSFLDPMFLFTLNKSLPYNDQHALMWSDTGAQVTSLLIDRANIDPIYEDIENNSINRYCKLRGLVLRQSINQ